ncbi:MULTISPECIES: sulfatase-like hydrolase/transferase [unclassified Oceanispirochaeta]|uniref:sulfatase-like hydrolase/transferase n=1 Tax=unclassified Oceanispirochaeta TaxID=2635722 RepID=UPI000E09907A|nr:MULTISPECIES: sulfatase-like hydrolase/transferase [unclassified Oceanispirochaeta]MBF9018297.1 sulfatase-like hydrolase/transferase [Oceanispirochaeta sp. M2]NPD74762.1 sulfatase-like hydrolase/transferase [Oceanispirochaeta sp. M1]RDG29376.1 DUF4976 domain-containing protein [Oceanispirochaeta sp. M1]
MKKKTNILMLVSDHQLHYRHGWDGGEGPKRPEFDKFASQGTNFDRAYSVTPLCGPARRSLLTGLYPHNHGNVHNQTESPYDHDIYFNKLADEGYRNYYYGKWHAGPGTALDFGCEGFCPSFYGNPYITKEYKDYLQKENIPKASHRIDNYFWNNSSKEKFKTLHEGKTDYFCEYDWCGEPCVGVTNSPKESHESFFLSYLACQKLEEIAVNGNNEPFHLRVDMWGPHQPYFPTQEYLDMYDPGAIKEYGSFRDNLENKPTCYQKMNRPIADENGNMIIPSVFEWEKWQQILAKAYAQTTMTDEAMGRIVKKLDDLGLGEDTVVIWTSDHGDALASHGGMFDKGSFMTEEIVRIPLAVRFPEKNKYVSDTEALVNTTDIAPTILDLAGTSFSSEIDGESLIPLCSGEKKGRQSMMIENYGQGYRDTQRSRTIVTNQFKYTIYEDDISELYNLKNDPYELNNLRNDKEIVRPLDKRLKDLILEKGDEDGMTIYKRKL